MGIKLSIDDTIILKDPESLKKLYVYKYIKLKKFVIRILFGIPIFFVEKKLKKDDIFTIQEVQGVGSSERGHYFMYLVNSEKLEYGFWVTSYEIYNHFSYFSKSEYRDFKIKEFLDLK